jgi:hypothetical protein
VVVTAAKTCGCRAVGVETVDGQVQKALNSVQQEQLDHLVSIKHMDAFDVDLRSASVVFLYLLPKGNRSLSSKLRRELAPGTRIVTYIFRCVCATQCFPLWRVALAVGLFTPPLRSLLAICYIVSQAAVQSQ